LAWYHKEYSRLPLAVDLFSGAGGLSLGLQGAGFRLALAVDQNSFAVETHAAYFPGVSVAADISSEAALDELLEPLRGRRIDLLSGGPPCQPFSRVARWIRSTNPEGLGSLRDHRRELWKSFLYATELLRPKAILLENVPDLALNEDGIILRSLFSKLEQLGYSFDCRAYFAYDLGVAQLRQRIFVVAFRNSTRISEWPAVMPKKDRPTLRDAISDLPPLRGGWEETAPHYGGPKTALQQKLRDGISADDLSLFDHVTRGVREDDLVAFKLLAAKTRYDKLPEELRRYDATSFTDKYNRTSTLSSTDHYRSGRLPACSHFPTGTDSLDSGHLL
jgi:DNA (cytosine-5)-methyltransferase 1